MFELPLLSALVLTPLVGAVALVTLFRNDQAAAPSAKLAALVVSLAVLVLGCVMVWQFDATSAAFQFVEKSPWFSDYNIFYYLGVDGISLWMVVLTALLMPICIVCSWHSITTRVRDFMALFLLLESLVIGAFLALDAMLFYLFFEGMLIPMFLIIGMWGGKEKIYAAYKFFLYTLAGSVLFLIAILYLYFTFGTTDMVVLMQQSPSLGLDVQRYLWLAMLASFAVKVPMWPVHTWLPDAHVQAPTAGSVILAGILLKLGGYGFLRFSLPMLPEASHYFADFMFVLSIVAVIYTSLVALVQTDMKKLIAYSSVAHMGFVTLGIFSFNTQGLEGAYIQMISHGLISGALFLCVGSLYDRMHTKEIAQFGGVVNVMPYFAAFFLLFSMASAGLPGTAGFVGEILVLVGAYQADSLAAIGAATGLVLGAAYTLWLYKRVMFGDITNPTIRTLGDASRLEWAYYAPLALLVLWLGIYPSSLTSSISPSIANVIAQVQRPLHGDTEIVNSPLDDAGTSYDAHE
jgi:NADH-quinone oxidoreductase subunit M